jgi:hypothetical protein
MISKGRIITGGNTTNNKCLHSILIQNRNTIATGRTNKEIISITNKKGERTKGEPEGTKSETETSNFIETQTSIVTNIVEIQPLTLPLGIRDSKLIKTINSKIPLGIQSRKLQINKDHNGNR